MTQVYTVMVGAVSLAAFPLCLYATGWLVSKLAGVDKAREEDVMAYITVGVLCIMTTAIVVLACYAAGIAVLSALGGAR